MYIVRCLCIINVLNMAAVEDKLVRWEAHGCQTSSYATWLYHCTSAGCHSFLQSGLINLSKNNNLLGVITSRKRRDASKVYPMKDLPDGPLPFPTKVGTWLHPAYPLHKWTYTRYPGTLASSGLILPAPSWWMRMNGDWQRKDEVPTKIPVPVPFFTINCNWPFLELTLILHGENPAITTWSMQNWK
jgi:hypothetical protein